MPWDIAVERVQHITFKLRVGEYEGTGFIVGVTEQTMLVATAWHVIEDLYYAENKHTRLIEMFSAVGDMQIKANAVGVARYGASDIGIVWVGPALSQKAVDNILTALKNSNVRDGLLDISGGGGILEVTGSRKPSAGNFAYHLLTRDRACIGMELGWLGYPSVASETLCLFRGSLSSDPQAHPTYLVDGTAIQGLSGGPVFDSKARIIGIVSTYLGDESTTSGLVEVAPVSELTKML